MVAENVAVSAPSFTVTVDGTWATFGSLVERLTTAPPAGAGPLNATEPLTVEPPETVDGRSSPVSFSETVKDAVFVTPPLVAAIWKVPETTTLVVVIGKLAVVAPEGMVTFAGISRNT